MTAPPASLDSLRRLLLDRAIDYAGLFPPAALGMHEAVRNYLTYRASPDAWALGRFVVPVTRLAEFEAALPAPVAGETASPILVSALIGTDHAGDVPIIEAFNRRAPVHRAMIDVVEVRAGSVDAVRRALAELPSQWMRYLELPFGPALGASLDLLAAAGARAKLRTGGTTAEAIPEPRQLAAALVALGSRRLPFKATAGLHHPITGEYPLTYDSGAARARMYGYLNLMAAAGLAFRGAPASEVERALLVLDEQSRAALEAARPAFLQGFGSCSFREPLDEFPRGAPGLRA